ncbi:hypothetical protein QWJ46_09220 [Rhizobium sp. CBN3]|nr:hypothetical protein [Rhizobium sp. CBN3]MDO3432864.1 hypothetical protein [Rhizobium sp. CBN3]
MVSAGGETAANSCARATALYTGTMYILAVMPAPGLIANALVRPLPDKWF